MTFDRELVVRQLRYTGMLETVRIRTLGYQWRFTFEVSTSHLHTVQLFHKMSSDKNVYTTRAEDGEWELRYNKASRDLGNVFVTTGARCIGVLFHTFYCNFNWPG